MEMPKAVEKAILAYMAEQNGVPEGDVAFWKQIRELLSQVRNERGILFTDTSGASYVIFHVAQDCYVVKGVNSETKISIPHTRQLQERIDVALQEAQRHPTVLICYDINDAKLVSVVEDTVRPTLQARLRGVTSVVTEQSDTELCVELGEPPQILAERQLEGADGVIMVITTGYLQSARFPHQLEMFRALGGRVFPVVYQNGLTLPPALAMLEHDDGFTFDRLDATIRRWLS